MFVLLKTRIASVLVFIHVIFLFVLNMGHILQLMGIDDGMTFQADFWAKQTTWKCGLAYTITELVLSLEITRRLHTLRTNEIKELENQLIKRLK